MDRGNKVLKVEYLKAFNFEGAFRGMRNPLESWSQADSKFDNAGNLVLLGNKDRELALRLARAGSDHRKFIRQIFVSADIIAPDYWWKEMDTYKVGTVSNSTSTMHKLASRHLTFDDFSFDEITNWEREQLVYLNNLIDLYRGHLSCGDAESAKKIWRRLIQGLPMGFHYRRTWSGNYENLLNIYNSRKAHKLIEWRILCDELETLPLSELFIKRS